MKCGVWSVHGVRVRELSLRVLGALRVSWEHEGGWLPRPGRQDDINAPVRTRNRGCLVADSMAARYHPRVVSVQRRWR